MNKENLEELKRDLDSLVAQRNAINGVIGYITKKIEIIELTERKKVIEENAKKEESTEREEK